MRGVGKVPPGASRQDFLRLDDASQLPQYLSYMKHFFTFIIGIPAFLLLIAATLTAHAQVPTWQTLTAAGQGPTNPGFSRIYGTAADASGNVYVIGSFQKVISIGSTILTSAGSSDVFVAKWSPVTASFIWAQRAGGAGYDIAEGIVVNGNNIYITGTYLSATADFGGISLVNPFNATGMFVAKLTDSGSASSFTWVKQGSSLEGVFSFALAVSGASVYVVGGFSGSVTSFGNTITSAGETDLFVTKLTDAGNSANFVWAQQAGGPDFENARSIAVNGNSLYVTGNYKAMV